MIGFYVSASEEADEIIKHFSARYSLRYVKFWNHFPASFHPLIFVESDMETTFTVNEPTDIPRIEVMSYSSLLIICTQHIFTQHTSLVYDVV